MMTPPPFVDCFLIKSEAMGLLMYYVSRLTDEEAKLMTEALTPIGAIRTDEKEN
jgi:hypothetical protein